MGYMYSLYTTRKLDHEPCKHPPPHHPRQVFKVIMNSDKTSKYWNHLQKRWVGFRTRLLCYRFIQDCITEPYGLLRNKSKVFWLAKTHFFITRSYMVIQTYVQTCTQNFKNLRMTDSFSFAIISSTLFSLATTSLRCL